MKESKAEEMLTLLTLIAGLLCFQLGWKEMGILLLAKTAFDFLCVVYFSIKEIREEKTQNK